MYSGGTRNQPKDGFFLKEAAQAGGWQSPTVVGGGGFQAGGWNSAPTAVNSDSKSTDFGLEPTVVTKPTTTAPRPTTTTSTATNGNNYARLGEALSGSQQYQARSKPSNPWAMEDAAFNMAGVGDLMGMVGKMRAIGGN